MKFFALRCVLPCAVAAAFAASAFAASRDFDYPDHYEFEASLHAPYRANADHARRFDMQFRFPGAEDLSYVAWRLDLVDANGFELYTWRGESPLVDGAGTAVVDFSERSAQFADGIYHVRMRAYSLNPLTEAALRYRSLDERVEATLLTHAQELEDQTFDVQIGHVPPPAMPAFKPLPTGARPQRTSNAVAATGGLPYTVYLGNLHSQTNLSDGGGPLSTCISEQNPQSGAGSPTDAYTYAMNEGLDFLMTSEHNHMFDGSTSTNASADPVTAHNLYQSGQTMRDNFNAAHPNFLALAGLEWGVISNGGHMNIFNTPKLLEWEYNGSNQLIGDIYTAKGDYASLYTLMKTNGWVGQFNHPATSGQFQVNGTALAYTADGDQAMALCEVMNSSAFSHNTTETETSRTSYEAACNILLEAGYHVAFSSDQDNHCSNWGASYTNRTGVLIPNGQALNQANFIAALQARHVYATYDKTSQIVLTTANGHIMGDRFSNSGSLSLTVNYAPGAGRSASQVQIIEGVPGSNGSVSTLASTATTTFTPATGEHFYYAKVTQDNGTLLYSAPIWVSQGTGGGDTTPPTVSAAESGTSGTITLSATANDNVGVSKVEFYLDGALAGTDTTSAYSMTLDSTTLSNGSHSLVAKAYDAAGNVGTSSAVSFTINNTTSNVLQNGVGITIADATVNHQQNWTMAVPAGATNLVFTLSGGTGDADLYVRFGSAPTTSSYDCRPYVSGNSETCTISSIQAGTYFVMVNAYAAYSGVTLKGSYTASSGDDTTPPTVSASESGTSGTITLSATASDNIGVAKVEFYVDGTLKGSDTSAPYAMTLDSTTLSNAAHTLVAKAYDAANNVGTSSTLSFTISNSTGSTQLLGNTGFETSASWTTSSGVISSSTSEPPHAGTYDAWLDGYGSAHTDTVSQTVTIPAGKTSATLQFYLHIDTDETSTTTAYDKLTVTVGSTTLATFSNLNAASGYQAHAYNVPVTAGSNVTVKFSGVEDSQKQTSFVLDDVTFTAQ